MNTFDRGGPSSGGISGAAFDKWVQKSDTSEDSTITKMQHQYWVTKQALSRKLGKKEDECIVASDAELDAKLELFRSIQESCSYLQRVIDKYQERLCNLAQEENAMGRFLKEAGKQDKTRAGKMMSAVGKSLSYSGQQRLALRAPLVRLYQEVETFRQRAIEDTLQNVQCMEKARTEYRAALSWMKNISQELDPDTSKQLERFRKVQMRVRRGKVNFDNQALDCLQKVDLLAAARCNMFSHALVLYQNTLLNFTKKSAQAYSTIANSFKGYQRYDFMVVKELVEPSTKLAQQTGGDQDKDADDDKLLFFYEYHDNVEEAQEAHPIEQQDQKKQVDKLVDFDTINQEQHQQPESAESSSSHCYQHSKLLEEDFFANGSGNHHNSNTRQLEESLAELDLAMDSFIGSTSNFDFFDDKNKSLAPSNQLESNNQESLQLLTSENVQLLDDILNSGPTTNSTEWDAMPSNDTFLPPGILQQSLGDATLGKTPPKPISDERQAKKGKQKGASSWLDLFAELDPLANNPIESLGRANDSNAPA